VTGRILRALAVALAAVGAWQVGSGVWIYAKAGLGQHLLQRAWARTLAGEREVKPWPGADSWPVARLRVPAHGIDLVVLDGVSGRTLGWAPGRAGGGPRGAGIILSGHRDTHFRFLPRLAPGDEIVVETSDRAPARFTVREAMVVDSRTAVIGHAPDGAAGLVLLTCYPFDALAPGGWLRYVVTADAVSSVGDLFHEDPFPPAPPRPRRRAPRAGLLGGDGLRLLAPAA
jgi:sortase A